MYYGFKFSSVYHVIEKPRWEGAEFTECGLVCARGRKVRERPAFLRLCKNCAKALGLEEKDGG